MMCLIESIPCRPVLGDVLSVVCPRDRMYCFWCTASCELRKDSQLVDLSLADAPTAAIIRKYHAQVEQEPSNPQLHGELGVVYELHGYTQAALNEYDLAITHDPTNPVWYYYRALVVANRVDLGVGLADMEKVVELDDLYAPAWLWRGTWLLDLARIDEARESFSRARDLGSYLPSKIGLVRAKIQEGEIDGAIADLEQLVAAYQLPYLIQLLGTAYSRAGNVVRAKEILANVHNAPQL